MYGYDALYLVSVNRTIKIDPKKIEGILIKGRGGEGQDIDKK